MSSSFNYYRLNREAVLTKLKVRSDQGLSREEASRRLTRFGKNEIEKKKRRLAAGLKEKLTDVMIWLLTIAALVSLALGEFGDAIIITAAIFVDTSLSWFQSRRAEKSLERLRREGRQTVLILRNGVLKKRPAEELVPGDIFEFREGTRVPADARLVNAQNIQVDQAALTGESMEVVKSTQRLDDKQPLAQRTNMLYMGTVVKSGQGRAVVTATGRQTELGKIAHVLSSSRAGESPLRGQLRRLGIRLSWIVVSLVGVIAGLSILRGETIGEAVRSGVTLIVSAIPEDVTLILTIALTVGMVRILKQKGVVRNLASAETLGSATVICTDKTGTLTQGKMTGVLFDDLEGGVWERGIKPEGEWLKLAYTACAVANDAHPVAAGATEYVGNGTERAALSFVEAAGLFQNELKNAWRLRKSLPFDTKWKLRAAVVDHPTNETQQMLVMGAPEELIERSGRHVAGNEKYMLSSSKRQELLKALVERQRRGQRLLGVAVAPAKLEKEDDLRAEAVRDLTFLGVLVITDPVRDEVREALTEATNAGVVVKIITGDAKATAVSVASQVGINVSSDQVLTGDDVAGLSDEKLTKILPETIIFARTTPLDKQRIVRLLQEKGEVVAMTGDGVNDAVALKTADIGVALGSGKDIAKDSADLILLDDSFKTIVAAIREGRVIRDNLKKVISFLLSTNVAEIGLFLASILLGLPLPLIPAQILWINLVTDGTSDVALSFEKAESDVMKRRPTPKSGAILDKLTIWLSIVFPGAVFTTVVLAIYWYLYAKMGLSLDYVRTVLFCVLAVSSLLSTWSYKSTRLPLWRMNWWSNPWLFASAGFSFVLQLIAVYTPPFQKFFGTQALDWNDWMLIMVVSVMAVLVVDLRKYLRPAYA